MSRFDTTTRFNHTARRTTLRTLAAATLLAASAAPTWAQQALTPEAARRVVTPFYEMLNRPATKDLGRAGQRQPVAGLEVLFRRADLQGARRRARPVHRLRQADP